MNITKVYTKKSHSHYVKNFKTKKAINTKGRGRKRTNGISLERYVFRNVSEREYIIVKKKLTILPILFRNCKYVKYKLTNITKNTTAEKSNKIHIKIYMYKSF